MGDGETPVIADMIEKAQSALTSLSAGLAETIDAHPISSTLITAMLASTAILAIGNGMFSRVQALKIISDARAWDDAWPKGSLREIADELRSDITRTERAIVVLSGLGLLRVAAIAWLSLITILAVCIYNFSRIYKSFQAQ